jgi:DNA-binding CsgD family transcriptional regulator
MASSINGAGGSQSPAPEVIEVIRKSSLAVLVLTVPEETIVAASPAAVELLGSDGEAVEGRSFEEFTVDEPSGGLDLILAGRLQGYETSRLLRRDVEHSISRQVWARAFDDDIPPRYVLAVISADANSAPTQLPAPAGEELPPVIGTADTNLLVDRVSSDVEAFLGYPPDQVLGRSLLGLVAAEDVATWLAAIAQATIARAGITMHVRARPADGPSLLCDALIFAMTPPPSCTFVLMPRTSRFDTGDRKPDIGEQLSRLSRGIEAVTLSTDLAAAANLRRVPGLAQLSGRELDIVRRLLTGDRVPAIAKALFLSPSTVRNHLARVYRKLGVGTQQELINLLRSSDTGTDS